MDFSSIDVPMLNLILANNTPQTRASASQERPLAVDRMEGGNSVIAGGKLQDKFNAKLRSEITFIYSKGRSGVLYLASAVSTLWQFFSKNLGLLYQAISIRANSGKIFIVKKKEKINACLMEKFSLAMLLKKNNKRGEKCKG